ncbi:MAG: nucleoside-diphosphate kinase [Candidatus Melainabacteria bacterium RIFOXYA12_FULL_32_12]|nr:MAG: nucleoside-diphosphate kinase [Candidatus Melainabacteria bacterium RIFOXYA2_FULL_32_9]OGI28645.1 MAG: nucleoside-diphosphate kinase [Candidatus Melainabacteria bacterium RIFOXYA12_FULL_32_12]
MERTFVAIKPDAVQRGLIGEIIKRFEKKGFKIIGMKMIHMSRELAEKHYAEHVGKPFYENLIQFITSGPILAMALQGIDVVTLVRNMMGSTNPQNAAPGTIRADYAQITERNIVHGSDSLESAKREIALFFHDSELATEWNRDAGKWITEPKFKV